MMQSPHQPVMMREVVEAISPRNQGIYVDATFGRGGYTRAMLEAADCRVIAIDRDPDAIAAGQNLRDEFPDRLAIIHGDFAELAALAATGAAVLGVGPAFEDCLVQGGWVDGITFDLGLSSPQVDVAQRGFSFRLDGPLDMRMSKTGEDAASWINRVDERELATVLWRYGEERASRRIAKAITTARAEAPINRTAQLATIIRAVLPRQRPGQIDPATRSFQAIRIWINDELDQLEAGLDAAEHLLADSGVLAVVSFHSLEDRIVKQFIRQRSGGDARPNRHQPMMAATAPPRFRMHRRKPAVPMAGEAEANPRARSARLRVAIRCRNNSRDDRQLDSD